MIKSGETKSEMIKTILSNLSNISAILIVLSLFSCAEEQKNIKNYIYGDNQRNHQAEDFDFGYQHNSTQRSIYNMDDSSGIIYPALFLNSLQSVVVTYDANIIMLDGTSQMWSKSFTSATGKDVALVAPACDSLGNIYIALKSGRVALLSSNGDIKWSYQFEFTDKYSIFNDILILDSQIVISDSKAKIDILSFDGKLLNSSDYNQYLYQRFPSIGNDLILPITHNIFGKTDTLISQNIDGSINWKFPLPNSRIISSPVISGGLIYVPTAYGDNMDNMGIVYVIDTGGNLHKKLELASIPRYITVAKDSTIFIASYKTGIGSKNHSIVYCFDKNYKLQWDKFIAYKITSPLYLYAQRLVFHCENEGNGIFVLRREDGETQRVISMHEKDEVHPIPSSYESSLVFTSIENNSFVYITQ